MRSTIRDSISADFDRYRDTYADNVERAIAFAGFDAAFFTELKAADLVSLSKRRLGPSAQRPRTRLRLRHRHTRRRS